MNLTTRLTEIKVILMAKKRLLHIALFYFTLTALTGVWLRLFVFSDSVQITEYNYILHGHSHIAVLGWTFFAAFLLITMLFEKQSEKIVKILTIALFIVTILMFIAFILQGYALFSIIFSTLHIFVQYVIAYFIIKLVRKTNTIPKSSRNFIYGSIVMLIISSIGPFALGMVASQGLRDAPIFDMAVYFYLHFQYNGWLTLILIGTFLIILKQKNILFPEKLMTYSFWFYTISLFPGYFLSVLWYDFGFVGIFFAVIGAFGQLIGVLFFILAMIKLKDSFEQQFSPLIRFNLYVVLFLLFVKSTMELGLLHLPLGSLVYETRSVVIGYLHLTLLGFISVFFMTQFLLTKLLDENSIIVKLGATIFFIGFTINELVLFSSGLFTWVELGSFPLSQELLLFASILLLISIIITWFSVKNNHYVK